jgi:2-dehydro-3-deoxyphosphogalactonate aldolase
MDLKTILARAPLIAILRGVKPIEVEAIGTVLVEAGIEIIEVPLNSPEPFASIEILVKRFGERALIGAGTVMTETDLTRLIEAGGRLMVTPHADAALVAAAKSRGLLTAPGFFTPAEAFALIKAGADALKLFPAEAGGPAMLKSIRAVLPPAVPVLPVGGITPESMRGWFEAGAKGFGIGSSIYKAGDSAAEVARKAKAFRQALDSGAAH